MFVRPRFQDDKKQDSKPYEMWTAQDIQKMMWADEDGDVPEKFHL